MSSTAVASCSGRIFNSALPSSQRKAPLPKRNRRPRRSATVTNALNIDRRAHLELAWQRQQLAEQLLAKGLGQLPWDRVVEVRDLAQLEQLLEQAGSSVVVVGFYSRSCGVCKEVFRRFDALCAGSAASRAGVRFARHEVVNEFDERSDIATMYGVKAVPRFAFFVDGALVKQVSMTDSRRVLAPRRAMEALLLRDVSKLQAALNEMLMRATPSARR